MAAIAVCALLLRWPAELGTLAGVVAFAGLIIYGMLLSDL
jgi:hypothetical protein